MYLKMIYILLFSVFWIFSWLLCFVQQFQETGFLASQVPHGVAPRLPSALPKGRLKEDTDYSIARIWIGEWERFSEMEIIYFAASDTTWFRNTTDFYLPFTDRCGRARPQQAEAPRPPEAP